MSADEIADRYRMMQRYLGWTEDDARRVAAVAPLVAPHAEKLIADFYAEIRRHPPAMRVITGGSEQIARLASSLRRWLVELLSGPYDDAYMARRWRVGLRHVEIGLAQRYASVAFSRLRAGIVASVETGWNGSGKQRLATLASLQKLLDLEHALIQDAYEFEYVRRQQELERQRGERRFRQLVENASCLIVILRPEEELLYFNRCAEDVTGFRADDLRRQHGSVLRLLGQDTNVVSRRLRAVLEQSVPQSYEERMQGRTGPPRWVTWTLTRIDEFEEGPAVLAVGHDVTEARLASEQLLQANRLATIGEMYTGLAHESRNALQRLRVCTDRLMDQVSDRPDAVEVLQRAQRAQDDLRQLLDEVRSFAAPIVLERTRCRLPALWREGWSLLQTMHRSRRATLADSGIDAGLEIVVDRFWIVQAFRNVLENALAACGDPAIIRIGCRLFQVEGSECVEITIEDNGPGFAMETVDRAFEPFFTTKSTGTGLGLAIVRRVIEAHGGVVAAGNGPDGGARIYLTLPCRAEP